MVLKVSSAVFYHYPNFIARTQRLDRCYDELCSSTFVPPPLMKRIREILYTMLSSVDSMPISGHIIMINPYSSTPLPPINFLCPDLSSLFIYSLFQTNFAKIYVPFQIFFLTEWNPCVKGKESRTHYSYRATEVAQYIGYYCFYFSLISNYKQSPFKIEQETIAR